MSIRSTVACVFVPIAVFAGTALGATLQVPAQYSTIQAAINAAATGDTVLVAAGTYPERIDLKGKAITLRSAEGKATTRITGNGSSAAILSCITSEPASCVVDGFTIYGGSASVGIAITTASPVIRNCDVKNCLSSTANGGGVVFSGTGGAPRFETCVFEGNRASGREGGAIYASATSGSMVCLNCTFTSNEATAGGGGGAIRLAAGSLTVTDCTFTSNFVTAYGPVDARGGAIHSSGALTVLRGTFRENEVTAQGDSTRIARGGAICSFGALDVLYSTFTANRASNPSPGCCGGVETWGGAIFLGAAAVTNINDSNFTLNVSTNVDPDDARSARAGAIAVTGGCDPSIRRCMFAGCSASSAGTTGYSAGGTLWYDAGCVGVVEDCVIESSTCQNEGGAVFLNGGATPYFWRTQFKNATTTAANSNGGGLRAQDGANAFLDECRFTNCKANNGAAGTAGGAVYVRNSHLFVDQCVFDANVAASGSALKVEGTGSPNTPTVQYSYLCGNSGTSTNWISGEWDDTHPGSVSQSASCGADCNQNGIVDAQDIAAGAADCDHNGQPDTCQADCDGDGLINACEIIAGAGDCDADGLPDSCEIAQGAADVNLDGIPDSCVPVDFAGLRTEIVPIVHRRDDPTIPATAICYRIYAQFTTTNAAVWSIYGNQDNASFVLSSPGGFYNVADLADTTNAVPCNTSAYGVGGKYDSWLTIGRECASSNQISAVGFDFTNFSTSGINDNDCGIVLAPGSAQGFVDPVKKRVLLAQVTTKNGNLPTGRFNLVGWNGNGSNLVAYSQTWTAPTLVDCNGNGVHDAYDIRNGTARDCDESGVPDVCEYTHPSEDCNNNGTPDLCDIYTGASQDDNRNGVPDSCECAGDVDGDGTVNIDDIVAVILSWGATGSNPADLNGDLVVGLQDLVLVLNYYGQCQ